MAASARGSSVRAKMTRPLAREALAMADLLPSRTRPPGTGSAVNSSRTKSLPCATSCRATAMRRPLRSSWAACRRWAAFPAVHTGVAAKKQLRP